MGITMGFIEFGKPITVSAPLNLTSFLEVSFSVPKLNGFPAKIGDIPEIMSIHTILARKELMRWVGMSVNGENREK